MYFFGKQFSETMITLPIRVNVWFLQPIRNKMTWRRMLVSPRLARFACLLFRPLCFSAFVITGKTWTFRFCFRKPQKHCRPAKPLSVSKSGEVYTSETSCVKATSVHVKRMLIKQLCNHELWVFAMAFRVRKLSGPLRNGPVKDLTKVQRKTPYCPLIWWVGHCAQGAPSFAIVTS